jgi:hypothetical protein
MIDVCDQNGEVIPDPDKHEDISFIRKGYEKMKQGENFIVKKSAGKSWEELAGNWVD